MELKTKLDSRIIFVVLYFVLFILYSVLAFRVAGASEYMVSNHLVVPSINLVSDVTTLSLENNKLNTPDSIVGSYSSVDSKTLLIGHSSTVFSDLYKVKVNDSIIYDNQKYTVLSITTNELESINMAKILESTPRDTIIIMTCAGEEFDDCTFSHRLILTAVRN